MDYLEARLTDDPDLYQAIGLVTQTIGQIAEGGSYGIGTRDRTIKPRDLPKISLREVAQLIERFAKHRSWPEGAYKIMFRWDSNNDLVDILPRLSDFAAPYDAMTRTLTEYINLRLLDEPEIINAFRLRVEPFGIDPAETALEDSEAGYQDCYEWLKV